MPAAGRRPAKGCRPVFVESAENLEKCGKIAAFACKSAEGAVQFTVSFAREMKSVLDWEPQPPYTAEQLVEVLRILRDPENGCPWDKVQTHASIRKNFLEETCEVLEAIDADDPDMMREELGDVLMQVAFHAVMEEERGRFTFEDVCRAVCEKLVFRHPNIFASSAAENAGINSWDALKNKEKGRTTLADELDTVPATLPALMRAQKLQKRAARSGGARPDKAEAQQALQNAVADWNETSSAEAAGRLLFAAVDAMRLAGVDAEEALTFASKRFFAEQKNQSGTQVQGPAPIEKQTVREN
jgi:MazG family protein